MPIRKSSLSGVPSGSTANRPSFPNIGDTYYNGTLGRQEIYTGAASGWKAMNSAAQKPTLSASNTSAAPFGNASADISITTNSLGGLPSSYTITSSPATTTQTTSNTSYTFTGLTAGTAYTFTATAENDYGVSASSTATSSITASTIPQQPTISASPTSNVAYGSTPTATVTVSGSNGGSSITNYSYSTDGSSYTTLSPAQISSPLTINAGFNAGSSYNLYVKAINANGTSTASSVATFTAATVPQAPTIGTPTAPTSTTVSLPFTAGNNGGSAITNYKYSTDGINYISLSPAQTTSPLIISGLAQNTSYTFRIKAVNAAGDSIASSQSSSVTTPIEFTLTYNLVAGGGGGFNANGGSGGAGGQQLTSTATVGVGTLYSVSIGAGGNGGQFAAQDSSNGGVTTFSGGSVNLSSTGGARAFGRNFDNQTGAGIAIDSKSGSGGLGSFPSPGGAGQNGGAGTAQVDGVTRAGGGGGAGWNNSGGTGGAGGGGNGASGDSGQNGFPGSTNTGGGGGGGGTGGNYVTSGFGGPGGSGIMVLRYPDSRTISLGAGVTGSTGAAAGGFKTTLITGGTGTVSWS